MCDFVGGRDEEKKKRASFPLLKLNPDVREKMFTSFMVIFKMFWRKSGGSFLNVHPGN